MPPQAVSPAVDVLGTHRDDVCSENSRCLLGYDELYEILSWMPAKSVIMYSSSLCKSLCDIHLDPHFIKKQCIHASVQDDGFILRDVIEVDDERDIRLDIEFHVAPWHTWSTFGTPWESLAYLPDYGFILSSSNGLFLVGNRVETRDHSVCYSEFWVCNPATREWAPLATPEGFTFHIDSHINALIECYPHATFHDDDDDCFKFPNDYTIALPVVAKPGTTVAKPSTVGYYTDSWHDANKLELLIYCNGRWEEECCAVSVENRLLRYSSPVAVFSTASKGVVVHYLCESRDRRQALSRWTGNKSRTSAVYLEPYIAAFDIRRKKLSREIKLPEGAWDADLDKGWGGSCGILFIFKWKDAGICLVRNLMPVHDEEFLVWVLDDVLAPSSSWRLLMNKVITGETVYGNSSKSLCINRFGVLSGRGLLIATLGAEVFLYVLEGEHRGRLELLSEYSLWSSGFEFLPYANTLRPVHVSGTDTFIY